MDLTLHLFAEGDFYYTRTYLKWYEVQTIDYMGSTKGQMEICLRARSSSVLNRDQIHFFFAEANFIKIVFKISEYQYYENMLNGVCNDNR